MKIFLATASTDDVAWGAAHGMLDGVLTSPGLLADDADAERARTSPSCAASSTVPIFASVHSVDAASAYRDGKELAKLSDQIVVQLPLVEETLGAMRRLQADGVRVVGDAGLQHGAGAARRARRRVQRRHRRSIASMPRDTTASAIVRDIRAAFDASDAECDVIALQRRRRRRSSARAPSPAPTPSPSPADLCRALLVHPLTDRGIDQFLGDVARLRRAWPAPDALGAALAARVVAARRLLRTRAELRRPGHPHRRRSATASVAASRRTAITDAVAQRRAGRRHRADGSRATRRRRSVRGVLRRTIGHADVRRDSAPDSSSAPMA